MEAGRERLAQRAGILVSGSRPCSFPLPLAAGVRVCGECAGECAGMWASVQACGRVCMRVCRCAGSVRGVQACGRVCRRVGECACECAGVRACVRGVPQDRRMHTGVCVCLHVSGAHSARCRVLTTPLRNVCRERPTRPGAASRFVRAERPPGCARPSPSAARSCGARARSGPGFALTDPGPNAPSSRAHLEATPDGAVADASASHALPRPCVTLHVTIWAAPVPTKGRQGRPRGPAVSLLSVHSPRAKPRPPRLAAVTDSRGPGLRGTRRGPVTG